MTRNKKIALLTLPTLALVVLGSSVAGMSVAEAHMMGGFRGISLTEEQKDALREARELRKEGDEDEAKRVLKEAGLNPGIGLRGGMFPSLNEQTVMRERHEAMRMALENNDFIAFRDATVDMPFASMVTEENFAKLVKAHELRESGDWEGARALLQDLGFPQMHRGFGLMHQGRGW